MNETYEELVERIAIAIFDAAQEANSEMCDGDQAVWKLPPGVEASGFVLEEWQRDDYRHMAKAAIRLLGRE